MKFRKLPTCTIIMAALAFLSYITTGIQWTGGFPSGEFRIKVLTENDKPIEGATLRVYDSKGRIASSYPLGNHITGEELVSDNKGNIVAVSKTNPNFGGHSWRLFWLIPMGDTAPEFKCIITAKGFLPLKFSVSEIFKSPHKSYNEFQRTVIIESGKEIELKIYKNTFRLEKD